MIIILLLHSAARGHYSPVSGSSGLSSYLCSRTIKKPSDGNHILHHTTENSSALAPWALLQVLMGTREERRQKSMWCLHQDTISAVYSQRPTGGMSTIYRGASSLLQVCRNPPPLLLLFLSLLQSSKSFIWKNNCHIKQRMKALREINMSFCSCVSSRGKYYCSFIA